MRSIRGSLVNYPHEWCRYQNVTRDSRLMRSLSEENKAFTDRIGILRYSTADNGQRREQVPLDRTLRCRSGSPSPRFATSHRSSCAACLCRLLCWFADRLRSDLSAASGICSLAAEFNFAGRAFAHACPRLVADAAGRVSGSRRCAGAESHSDADDSLLFHKQLL